MLPVAPVTKILPIGDPPYSKFEPKIKTFSHRARREKIFFIAVERTAIKKNRRFAKESPPEA
jgi:hypothetical protein